MCKNNVTCALVTHHGEVNLLEIGIAFSVSVLSFGNGFRISRYGCAVQSVFDFLPLQFRLLFENLFPNFSLTSMAAFEIVEDLFFFDGSQNL